MIGVIFSIRYHKGVSTAAKLRMFCAKEIEARNLASEHLVPKCLWGAGYRPINTRTLPAHKACNQGFSQDNEYFRAVLAFEAGASRDPAAKQVQKDALKRKLREQPGNVAKTLRNPRPKLVRTRAGVCL